MVPARIKQKHSVEVRWANSLAEAEEAAREHHFDIIFFGLNDWEEGLRLYIEILDRRKSSCQFILFMDNPADVKPFLDNELRAVAKPDWEKWIDAADWRAPTPFPSPWMMR